MSFPKTSILAVDDDLIARRSLAFALRHEGFEVTTAAAAPDGGRFDIGVIDLQLLDRSGVEVAIDLLRGGVIGQVVFYTGTSDEQEKGRARTLGPVVEKSRPSLLITTLHVLSRREPDDRTQLGCRRTSGIYKLDSQVPADDCVPRPLSLPELDELLCRTRGTCTYCGRDLRLLGRQVEVTHWLAPGEFHDPAHADFHYNRWPACNPCAKEKGSLGGREYLAKRILARKSIARHWEDYEDLVVSAMVELDETSASS